MSYYSPLRYPGGKRKLLPFFKAVFEANNLCDGTYVEPYAGGAAVALGLLLGHYAWRIIINDADRSVYAFWWSVLNDTERLNKRINDTPITIEQWHICKSILQHQHDHGLSDLGFATFFLNRTNRSGIIDGGVIGGQDQSGPYGIDARFNKQDLIKRIELIALYKNRIDIQNQDAATLLSGLKQGLGLKSLIYLDPPYFVKGRDLYQNHYGPEDHKQIADLILNINTPWIVTYDNTQQIFDLYTGVPSQQFSLYYSANEERKKGAEVMFYNLSNPPNHDDLTGKSIYWASEEIAPKVAIPAK